MLKGVNGDCDGSKSGGELVINKGLIIIISIIFIYTLYFRLLMKITHIIVLINTKQYNFPRTIMHYVLGEA